MGPIPITAQLCIKTCSRKKHGKGGWTEQETRLARRSGKI